MKNQEQAKAESFKVTAGNALPGQEVHVLVFGQLADVTGMQDIYLRDINDTDQLMGRLEQLYSGLRGMKYIVAVDQQMTTGNTPLMDRSTVALLPPFSGG